jgi:hypothetical protein
MLLDEARAMVPLSVARHDDIERLRATAKREFVPVR